MPLNAIHLRQGAGAADLLRTGFHVVTEDSSGHVVVRLHGDLDRATTIELQRSLASVLAQRPKRVTVDLAQLEFIDSTGVGALVGSLRRAEEQSCTFALRFPSRPVMKVLHLTGIDQIVHIERPAG